MSREYIYEKSNSIINKEKMSRFSSVYEQRSEEYCYSVKCKNNKVCNGLLPDRWYEVRGRYLCIQCEKTFGKLNENPGRGELKFTDNIVCLQCNNKCEGVSYPRCEPHCDHYLCLKCFDNNWYNYNKIPAPEFPYNEEIQEQYYDDYNNNKWDNYELIDLYLKQMKLWNQLKNEIFDKYEPFRKCPICKK